jgi:single-strand DNA-binding protein
MINKTIFVGRCGKDPDVRTLGDGTKVASFSLATWEKYKNKSGEPVEETTWHNISCFRNLAEVVEKYVKKGEMLYIEGKIKNRSYDDKEGRKIYVTDIVADTMKMVGGKKEEDNRPAGNSAPQPVQTNQPKPVTSGGRSNESQAPSLYPPQNDDLPF